MHNLRKQFGRARALVSKRESALAFPGIWLAATFVLGSTHMNFFVALAVCFCIGLASYTIARSRKIKASNSAASIADDWEVLWLALLLVPIFIGTVLVYALALRIFPYGDAIGGPYDEGWGYFPCGHDDQRSFSKSGNEALVRYNACPGLMAGQDHITYYVFVHRKNQPNDLSTMVLRYDPSATMEGMAPLPIALWKQDGTLQISLNGPIGPISKQRFRIDNILIEYRMPKPIDENSLGRR